MFEATMSNKTDYETKRLKDILSFLPEEDSDFINYKLASIRDAGIAHGRLEEVFDWKVGHF